MVSRGEVGGEWKTTGAAGRDGGARLVRAIVLHDPVAGVGGLRHCSSRVRSEALSRPPGRFARRAVPTPGRGDGGGRRDGRAAAAGWSAARQCSRASRAAGWQAIGARNIEAATQSLSELGIRARGRGDRRDAHGRSVYFEVATDSSSSGRSQAGGRAVSMWPRTGRSRRLIATGLPARAARRPGRRRQRAHAGESSSR